MAAGDVVRTAPAVASSSDSNNNEPRGDLEAERMYETALTRSPPPEVRADLLFNLAKVRERLGREGVEDLYGKALDAFPGHVRARTNLGVLKLRRGEMEEALAVLSWSDGEPRDLADLENNRGIALETVGRLEEAIEAYERAIELSNGEDPNPLTNLGTALGSTDRGLDSHRRARNAAPEDATVRYNLAATLEDLGNSEEALAEYREAIRLFPGYAAARNNLALLLDATRGGDPQEIASHFEIACDIEDDVDYLCNLGAFRRANGDVDKAFLAYEKAVALADVFDAHLALSELYAAKGHIDAALRHAKLAVKLAPPDARPSTRDFLRDLLTAWHDTLDLEDEV
ncbi:hypothetical protein CTAYLR_010693 [Chrysophaeum taylorii]|uniref:Tetratricopeptide repeat protein n=1 Tax=Chrysophaeum taylorii TaxID=2483200 RepID=A0AAD7XH54_9STRA|nr:hypothetical protein CTAYLR_010693 [Chrysophaeum taylorii]